MLMQYHQILNFVLVIKIKCKIFVFSPKVWEHTQFFFTGRPPGAVGTDLVKTIISFSNN